MYQSKNLTDYEEYFKTHEELKPEWREFMEPEMAKAEDQVFMFVLGTVLM